MRKILRQSVVSFVVLTLVSTLFLFMTSAQATEVTIGGIPNGATYNRLADKPITITIDMSQDEDQRITRIDLRLESLNAPLFGTSSTASINADGGLSVGSPKPFIRSGASCTFEQTDDFGYGYGYGYGPGGQFGYGYGYGDGFGYGYGYGYSALRIVCNVVLALPLIDLGALQSDFALDACIIRINTPVGNPGECADAPTTFVVYDEYPIATITPLTQAGNAAGFTANFQLQAEDPDRPISQSKWTLDYGDGTFDTSFPILPPSPLQHGAQFNPTGVLPVTLFRSHVYADASRTYIAYLNVTDADGATAVEQVTVGLPPAVRLIPVNVRGDAPLTVNWELTIDDLTADESGYGVERWALNFGDGDSREGTGAELGDDHKIVIPHTYATPGTYVASVAARDTNGLIGTDESEAIVDLNEKCVPVVRFSALDGQAPTSYNPDDLFTTNAAIDASIQIAHQGLDCGFINNAPHLVGGWVDKTRAGTRESVVFRVTYFDLDGDMPTTITAQVGTLTPFSLAREPATPANNDPVAGITYASAPQPMATVPPAEYDVTFHASDGTAPKTVVLVKGLTVALDTRTESVLLANPTNRIVLSTLANNAPAEVLPPLEVATVNGIDSFFFPLDALAVPGVAWSLHDASPGVVDDWDICFYTESPRLMPTQLKPILPCHMGTSSPATGVIPAGAKFANVWRDANMLGPSEFRFDWIVTIAGTQPPVASPLETGTGVLKVWKDLDGDNTLGAGETALLSEDDVAQQLSPLSRELTLETATDDRYRFVASFSVDDNTGLATTQTTHAVVAQRFVNDLPVASLSIGADQPRPGVPVTFTLTLTDEDDSQGETAQRLGGLARWELQTGENTVQSPAGPIDETETVQHTYPAPGTYLARLEAWDYAGGTDVFTLLIHVRPEGVVHTATATPLLTTPGGGPQETTEPAPTTTTSSSTRAPTPTTTRARPTVVPSQPASTGDPTEEATETTTAAPTSSAATPTPGVSSQFALNVRASPQADGSIIVSWQAPTDVDGEIGGWLIWRASSPFTLVARVDDPSQRTYKDATAEEGKEYNYVVSFFYKTGQGLVDSLEQVTGFVDEASLPNSGYRSAGVVGTGLSTSGGSSSFLTTLLIALAVLIVAALISVGLAMRSGPETTTILMPTTSVLLTPTPPPADGLARVIERVNEGGTSEQFLLLHCTRCNNNFETTYSEERPLIRNCGSCGRLGILPPLRESVGPPRGPTLAKLGGPNPDEISRLQAWGITTSEQLRAANVEEVASLTHIEPARLHEWQARAELVRIKGISPEAADLLVRAGIRGTGELAAMDHKAVTEHLLRMTPDAKPDRRRIDGWIHAAQNNQLDKWAEPA